MQVILGAGGAVGVDLAKELKNIQPQSAWQVEIRKR